MKNMLDNIEKVYFSSEQLAETVSRLGERINSDYRGRELLLICVLKGSVIFTADLMRSIELPCKIEFLSASSYKGTASVGTVQTAQTLPFDVAGKDVIIVEDIFDTGRTLQTLYELVKSGNPSSLEVCTLLDKPERRVDGVTLRPKYIGETIENKFVVGYGLDCDQEYRNLPFVGIMKTN